jgi:hypothetical protein
MQEKSGDSGMFPGFFWKTRRNLSRKYRQKSGVKRRELNHGFHNRWLKAKKGVF